MACPFNASTISNIQIPLSFIFCNKFLVAFRKKIANPLLIQNAKLKLDVLKQTVLAHYYLTFFIELARHLDITKQTKITQFMKGLEPSAVRNADLRTM